jgi:hypothetical protein
VIATVGRRRAGIVRRPALVAIALGVVIGLALLRTGDPRSSAADRPASGPGVASYLAALDRLGADGGQVVVDGMRPGLADIAQQRLPDDVLARMADGWVASMRGVQHDVRALEVPAALAPAAVRFERALSVYVRLAETLRAAVAADGDARDALVDDAVALGHEADRLYDEALAMLAEVRP